MSIAEFTPPAQGDPEEFGDGARLDYQPTSLEQPDAYWSELARQASPEALAAWRDQLDGIDPQAIYTQAMTFAARKRAGFRVWRRRAVLEQTLQRTPLELLTAAELSANARLALFPGQEQIDDSSI